MPCGFCSSPRHEFDVCQNYTVASALRRLETMADGEAKRYFRWMMEERERRRRAAVRDRPKTPVRLKPTNSSATSAAGGGLALSPAAAAAATVHATLRATSRGGAQALAEAEAQAYALAQARALAEAQAMERARALADAHAQPQMWASAAAASAQPAASQALQTQTRRGMNNAAAGYALAQLFGRRPPPPLATQTPAIDSRATAAASGGGASIVANPVRWLPIAQQALAEISQRRVVSGNINRGADDEAAQWGAIQKVDAMRQLEQLRASYAGTSNRLATLSHIKLLAEKVLAEGAGNCHELAVASLWRMCQLGARPVHIANFTHRGADDSHVVAMAGHPGEYIVCDAWAGVVCQLHEYASRFLAVMSAWDQQGWTLSAAHTRPTTFAAQHWLNRVPSITYTWPNLDDTSDPSQL